MAETGEGGKARYYCAAEGCHADTLKKERYGYMHDIEFFPFPTQKKDPKGRRTWINLLRRKDYDPPRHHRVCSRHFEDGRPTTENPYPTLFSYNNYKEPLNSRSEAAINKRACIIHDKQDAHESQGETDFEASDRCELLVNMNSTNHGNPLVVSEEIVTTAESEITGVSQYPPDHEYALASSSHDNRTPLETVEIGIQTELGMAKVTEPLNIKEKSQNPDAVIRELFTNKVRANDKSVKKYTGLPSKSILEGLYDVLDSASPCLKY